MNTTVRRGAVVVLLALFAACEGPEPTSPTATSPPLAPPPATPRPPIEFPPLSGASRTFIFDGELTYRLRSANPYWRLDVSDYTKTSFFVLYDNGAFVLHYPSLGDRGYGYRGKYQDANGAVMFMLEFNGRRVGDPWDATGTFAGESLMVQYDEGMKHADFEDAVYVLMP